jgi:hypothetical protein
MIAALIVSAALVARTVLRGETVKILELGGLILFALLVLVTLGFAPDWTVARVRLAVDAGLLAIVLFSLVIGRPFTMQYARERVSEEYWNSPQFFATSRLIAIVWAVAFAVLVAADAAAEYVPAIPVRVDVWVSIAALAGAFSFTNWYPKVARRRSGRPAG